MQEVIPLIRELAVLLGVASIAVLICQKLHQPIVLGYLVAGIIVGPHTPPYALVSNTGQIHMLSELGVIFLMFATGLEFSFHRLKQVGFSAVFTGLVEVLVTFGLGLGLGRLLHYGAYESLFLGAALSISSTTIIVKTFDELGLKGKHFTNIVFGALILEDLLAILILTSLSTILVKGNFLSLAMLWGLVKLIAVIGSWFFIGYFGMPFLFRKIGNYISEELRLRCAWAWR